MTCPLPASQDRKVPAAVSVVGETQLCEGASNVLKVLYDPVSGSENTKKFAVCSKGLDFPHHDISVRLVQWIEISRALGADKIFLYQLDLHPNIVKVMTVKGQFKRVPYLYISFKISLLLHGLVHSVGGGVLLEWSMKDRIWWESES